MILKVYPVVDPTSTRSEDFAMAVSEASESPPESPGSTPSPINTPGLNGGGMATKQVNFILKNFEVSNLYFPCLHSTKFFSQLELSVSEDQALQTFLSHVNGWRTARGYSALTPRSSH